MNRTVRMCIKGFTSAVLACTLAACAGTASAAKTAGTYDVTLEENKTTDYSWSYDMSADGIVSMTADEYLEPSASPQALGAPGSHTWHFEAVKAGTVTVTFQLEGNTDHCVAKKIVYDMTVDDKLQITASSVETDTPCTAPSAAAADMGTFVGIEGSQIEMSASANDGYQWTSFGETADDLKIVSIEQTLIQPWDGGAGSEYFFTVTGLQPGTAKIGLTYHKGMDADGIASTSNFTVTVAQDLSVTITFVNTTGKN